MKTKKLIIATFSLMGFAPLSSAQEKNDVQSPMMTLSAGVQTYDLARFGIEPNAKAVSSAMSLAGIANDIYDVLVNGEKCYMDYNTILVGQTEYVQVIVNPDGADNMSGTAYTINLVMKEVKDGIHGDVSFNIDSKGNYAPAGSIRYRKDKWSMWGSISGDIYKANIHGYNEITNIDSHGEYKHVRANFGMEYKDSKNVLSFNFSNNWEPWKSGYSQYTDFYTNDGNHLYSTYTLSSSRNIDNYFTSSVNYKRIVNDKLSLNISLAERLSNIPRWDTRVENYMNLSDFYLEIYASQNSSYHGSSYSITNTHQHSNNTKMNVYADIHPLGALVLNAGVLANLKNESQHSTTSLGRIKSHYMNVAPYLFAKYKVGNWTFNAAERVTFSNYDSDFSCDMYNLNEKNEKIDTLITDNHNYNFTQFNTNVGVTWSPSKNHQMQLVYKRADNKSYMPYTNIPTYIYNNSFNYFITGRIKDEANAVFMSYAYNAKNINAGLNAKYESSTSLKANYDESNEISNTARSTDTKIYDVSAFSTATFGTFSIYGLVDYFLTKESHSTKNIDDEYWQISIRPTLSLPDGLYATASIYYTNRKTKQSSEYTGNFYKSVRDICGYSLRLSKQWGGLNVYADWSNRFYDNVTGDELRYDYDNNNMVTFGASYCF